MDKNHISKKNWFAAVKGALDNWDFSRTIKAKRSKPDLKRFWRRRLTFPRMSPPMATRNGTM